jgi:hypothetical protein
VGNVVVGDGTSSRSVVRQVVITFDGLVTLDANAFHVHKRGAGGGAVGLVVTPSNSGGKTMATLTFVGAFVETGGSLKDGNFDLTIDATKVHDAADNALDGNRDGAGGDDFTFGTAAVDAFFRLFGDTNGDRLVGIPEFNQFRSTFGKKSGEAGYNSYFDSNGDGVVGTPDFNAFRARFGKKLAFE